MMKKAILCVLTVLSLTACGDNQKPAADGKPVIKIGATLPLSGNMAFGGAAAQKALELALADMSREMNLKYEYRLHFENDMMEPKQALLNVRRLQSTEQIQAIVSMWLSSPTIAEHTNRQRLLHLGCSWGYGTAKGLYNFNHSTFHTEQTALLLKEFAKRGIRKIGIISNATPVGEEVLEYLRHKLPEAGAAIVFDMIVNPGEKDFRTAIEKMKRANADAVGIFLLSPGMEIFAKQAKELGYQPPFVTFNNFAYHPEYWEGQWFIADADGTAEFKAYFKEQTGMDVQSCTVNLYEGLRMMVRAYETAPAKIGQIPDNKDVAEKWLKFEGFESAAGKAAMDAEGNIHAEPALAVIKGGKASLMGDMYD